MTCSFQHIYKISEMLMMTTQRLAIGEGLQYQHQHQRCVLWASGESLCSSLAEGKWYLNFQRSRKCSPSSPPFPALWEAQWKFRRAGPECERGSRWNSCPLQQKHSLAFCVYQKFQTHIGFLTFFHGLCSLFLLFFFFRRFSDKRYSITVIHWTAYVHDAWRTIIRNLE